MTEYRVAVVFKDSEIRLKHIKRNTLADAIKTANDLKEAVESGSLAPYWYDAKVIIEAREVSKWTPIN